MLRTGASGSGVATHRRLGSGVATDRLLGSRLLLDRLGTSRAEDALGHADQLVGPVPHQLEPRYDLFDPVLQPLGGILPRIYPVRAWRTVMVSEHWPRGARRLRGARRTVRPVVSAVTVGVVEVVDQAGPGRPQAQVRGRISGGGRGGYSHPFIGPCASSGWSYSSCQFHQLYAADCG